MKSSNVLLTLWCLVIFGVVFAAVFFFVRARQQEDVRPPAPVQIGTKSPLTKGTPTGKPPQTQPRSGRPAKAPVIQQIRGRVTDAESKGLVGVAVTLLPPAKAPPPPPAKDLAEVRRVALIIDIAREDAALPRPVAAWVEAPAVDPSRFEGAPITTAVTAEDGSYFLEVPRTVQGPFRVVARSETLGSASRSGVSVGTMDCDLQIATAGVVTGAVTSEASGGPVASCRLVFSAADREWAAVTDADGAFRIEDMPAGRYSIRAGAPGFVPVLDQEIAVIRSEPVKIRLPRGTTMRVRAVLPTEVSGQRPEDGSPVADCEIVALEETSYAYFIGKTNSNGIVEFPGIPAGVWLVNGRGPGVIPVTEERIVVRAADAAADVLLEFEAAVDTPLTVVDEEGQPVAGVEFYAGTPDEEFDTLDSEKLPGATDDRGNYKFPFEFMGRRARVFGFKKGYAILAIAPEDYSAGEGIRVTARKGVKISGVVRTPDGKPIPGAIVSFTVVPPESAADFFSDAVARIVAGPDGRYEFTHIPVGWQTTVEAETLEGQYSDESEDVEPTKDVELNFTIDLETKITAVEMPGTAPKTPAGSGDK